MRICAFKKFFALLLLTALLCGCQTDPAPQSTTTAPTVPPTAYSVRFEHQGQLVEEQIVPEGETPSAVRPEKEGLVFAGWQDASGAAVSPETVAVNGDVVYTAVMYPDLSNEVPYLTLDEYGFVRPDDALTADELYEALRALAAPGAQRYFPGMPLGAQAVSVEELRPILEHCFGQTAVAAAFDGLTEGEVKRSTFACIMNVLQGRDMTQGVTIAEDAVMPMDLAVSREDCTDVLEAAVAHEHAADGQTWEDVALSRKHEPGFVNLGGWLYYADETGALVRDTQIGELTFGPDGRFTCGDAELDQLVAGILHQIISDNPGLERLDILRKAYEYSRDSFMYLRKEALWFGETGWEIDYAKVMLTGGRGNCYNYAAVFWALARGLGYEARAISGTMTVTNQSHGWVEIDFDGVPYIFDPETEMVYIFQREIYQYDMFMMTYKQGEFWDYIRP